MTERRLVDLLRDAGIPDLIELLADRFSPADLDAILFETHRRRARHAVPSDLLAHYRDDPHVAPSPADAAVVALVDRLGLQAAGSAFEPVELSPVCPVGTVAALTTVDPGAAWGAAGRGEVVSEARAVLAIEAASRRRGAAGTDTMTPVVRLATSHRELHLPFSAPLRSTGHERVLALCTAGRLEAVPWRFEVGAVVEQVATLVCTILSAKDAGLAIGLVTATLYHEATRDLGEELRWEVIDPLATRFPEVRLVAEQERRVGRGFYSPFAFTITVEDRDEVEHRVAMGGCTDWTRQLLDRPEEALVVSTLATERLVDVCGMER